MHAGARVSIRELHSLIRALLRRGRKVVGVVWGAATLRRIVGSTALVRIARGRVLEARYAVGVGRICENIYGPVSRLGKERVTEVQRRTLASTCPRWRVLSHIRSQEPLLTDAARRRRCRRRRCEVRSI